MIELEIDEEEFSAYGAFDYETRKIVLFLPNDKINKGHIKAWNFKEKRKELLPIFELTLAILEHEILHAVIFKEIGEMECHTLDNTEIELICEENQNYFV